jgi:hypothetical protein
LKCEVFGKPVAVAAELLIQPLCGDAVEFCKISVHQNALSAHDKDLFLKACGSFKVAFCDLEDFWFRHGASRPEVAI